MEYGNRFSEFGTELDDGFIMGGIMPCFLSSKRLTVFDSRGATSRFQMHFLSPTCDDVHELF